MRHLSKDDLSAIDELARLIADAENWEVGQKFCMEIAKQEISVELQKCTSPACILENGAEYKPRSKLIYLNLACPTSKFVTDEVSRHVRWLLVHEATHCLHIECARAQADGQECPSIDALNAAGKLAANCKENQIEEGEYPECDYITYVSCAAERPAHAAQLAMEVRESTSCDFKPKNSRLYSHFQKRCGNPADESNLKLLICDLFEDAKKINKTLA